MNTLPATLNEFIVKLDKVVEHIELGKEIKARYLFNTKVVGLYNREEWFSQILFFYTMLDEYLNAEKLFDLEEDPSKEELLDEYSNEYKKTINSIRSTQ